MSARRVVVSAMLCLVFVPAARAAGIHYVRADALGAGDGTSWADAFSELQPALGVALPGDQIWVAAGTYTPAAGGLDKLARFILPSAVGVFGGFAGTESVLTQRDPAAHVTVLSGDLLGDDALGESHWADNSVQILHAEGTQAGTTLDGFSIRDAKGYVGNEISALKVVQGSLVVRQCGFVANDHGAVRCTGAGATVLDRCLFLDNIGRRTVMTKQGHALDMRNCIFVGNVNTLSYAGALESMHSTTTVHGCLFIGNRSEAGSQGAGGIFVNGGTLTITNSTFSGNSAKGTLFAGGCLYVSTAETIVTISNSIFWGNSANTLLLGQDEIWWFGEQGPDLENCILQAWSFQTPGSGTLALDPKFLDADGADNVLGTADDDLRLQPGSPAIDSGLNAAVPPDILDEDADGDVLEPQPLDVRGVNRFEHDPQTPGQEPVVDRGACEFSRWTALGHALGGATAPCLVGFGSWIPGQPLGLRVTGGKPNAFGLLFLGATALDAPFKGGTMVPYPLFGNGIVLDAAGSLQSQALLPADAPSQFTVYLQAWFKDSAGPQGHTATSATSGTVK